MEKQITVAQAINETISILGGINVPGDRIREIGIPLMQAIENLKLCASALENAAKEQNQEHPEEETNTLFENLNDEEVPEVTPV